MTLAAHSAMIQKIFLGVRASVVMVVARMCHSLHFWDPMRLMRTSALRVAAIIHAPVRLRPLHLSQSAAVRAPCTTHQVRHFGVRNRATHVLPCFVHLPGIGVMCNVQSVQKVTRKCGGPIRLQQNCLVSELIAQMVQACNSPSWFLPQLILRGISI